MDKYICIHGHFYQPPRENAWLEDIEMQDSASLDVGTDDFSRITGMAGGMSGLDELQGFGEDMQSMPPPGMDEALSFAKILEYAEDDFYDTVILDTAPTGHTLRLLNIPEFLDSFLGRMLRMKTFISNAMTMVKSLFGGKQDKDRTVETLEAMKETWFADPSLLP